MEGKGKGGKSKGRSRVARGEKRPTRNFNVGTKYRPGQEVGKKVKGLSYKNQVEGGH